MTTNDNKDCSLNLRRAQGHRPGDWNPEDFDVLDDGPQCRPCRRIGIDFMLTGRKSYGDADTRVQAMAAFRAEDERWLEEQPKA